MPTSTKTRKGNPATKRQSPRRIPRPGGNSQEAGQSSRRFPHPGGSSQATQERSRFPRASAKPSTQPGLMGRAQANLPGRKPQGRKNAGVKGVLSGLGGGSSERSRKPSKKGMLGIVAITGLGAAAIAKRRRDGSEDGASTYPPVQPAEVRSEESSTPPADPPVSTESEREGVIHADT